MNVCTRMIVQKIKSTHIYCEQEFIKNDRWAEELISLLV